MTETFKISDVCTWDKENDRVKINISGAVPKEIVVTVDRVGKLDVKHSETNLEIVVSRQEGGGGKTTAPPTQVAGSEDGKGTDKNDSDKKSEEASRKQSNNDNAPTKQSEEGSRKQSDNVLGNVMNVLKDYKGIVITAVIAISLGFLLRRKFKVV